MKTIEQCEKEAAEYAQEMAIAERFYTQADTQCALGAIDAKALYRDVFLAGARFALEEE